jgi:hypothetical protein
MREKNRCAGCSSYNKNKPKYCISCSIKNCEHLKGRFCFTCSKYPCRRLKQLDKRYRKSYNVSLINNLETIKSSGIRNFIRAEKQKWECPSCSSKLSVHRKECIYCGINVTAKPNFSD